VIVVADASPLIFLAKLRRLDLIAVLFGEDVRVPQAVADEVLAPGTDHVELDLLEAFLRQCRVESVRHPQAFASAMSRADNEAVTLAVRARAGMLLCDDKLTRRMAEAEGIRPLSTLGILLMAMRQQRLTPDEARMLLDRLVESHDFRIGIGVYQAALKEILRAR
jgi:predicted nucleic acid-binding protein